jgi:hypothetical protein
MNWLIFAKRNMGKISQKLVKLVIYKGQGSQAQGEGRG